MTRGGERGLLPSREQRGRRRLRKRRWPLADAKSCGRVRASKKAAPGGGEEPPRSEASSSRSVPKDPNPSGVLGNSGRQPLSTRTEQGPTDVSFALTNRRRGWGLTRAKCGHVRLSSFGRPHEGSGVRVGGSGSDEHLRLMGGGFSCSRPPSERAHPRRTRSSTPGGTRRPHGFRAGLIERASRAWT